MTAASGLRSKQLKTTQRRALTAASPCVLKLQSPTLWPLSPNCNGDELACCRQNNTAPDPATATAEWPRYRTPRWRTIPIRPVSTQLITTNQPSADQPCRQRPRRWRQTRVANYSSRPPSNSITNPAWNVATRRGAHPTADTGIPRTAQCRTRDAAGICRIRYTAIVVMSLIGQKAGRRTNVSSVRAPTAAV